MPLLSDDTLNIINSMPEIRQELQDVFGADKRKKGFVCPLCNNGAGRDGDGVTQHRETHVWKCFKCGEAHPALKWLTMSGERKLNDVVKDICSRYHITPEYQQDTPKRRKTAQPQIKNAVLAIQEAAERAENAGGISTYPEAKEIDSTAYYEKCRADLQNTSYWAERGLSLETCQKHWIGYDPQKKGLVIPNTKSSYLVRYVEKGTDEKGKVWNPPGIAVQLFNEKALYEKDRPVFIVEGAIDALSIEEAGGSAVALNSTSNTRLLLEAVEKIKPKTLLIIAMDNDSAGRQTSDRLKTALDEKGINSLVYNIYGEHCKDANEMLVKYRHLLADEVGRSLDDWQKMKLWRSSNAGKLSEIFEQYAAEKEHYPTGFSDLDSILDGGLFPGLYIMGAISSLGKTTFLVQLADNLAKSGQHVLYFSLEMSTKELVAKSLSRISAEEIEDIPDSGYYPLTTRKILSKFSRMKPKEREILEGIRPIYEDFAGNIFVYARVGDITISQIEEITAAHIRETGKRPVVMIDYLQILKPVLDRATDKQETDNAVKRLKLLAESQDVPVVAISSFNRQNYLEPVNMSAFKESGRIIMCHAA